MVCEYLVVAIEDDDFEAFKSAYSGFFGVVLLYHEYVRSDVVKIKELHKQSAVFHFRLSLPQSSSMMHSMM